MIPGLSLFPEPEETIEGVGRMLRTGETTCAAVVERCLSRIDHWEDQVRAWSHVDREGAMRQARDLDRELADGRDRGPLHGIPIGVKHIIDVKGMPTASGTSGPINSIAEGDAFVVECLRMAGAILLGKTVSTAIAWIDPPPTRNPWGLGRTPGGSSSGSAVALACGMCLGAIGTQTGGSITRPAAYCGVASLKPSDVAPRKKSYGILPLAPSLDTPGVMARSVTGLVYLRGGMWMDIFERPADPPLTLPPEARPVFRRLCGFFDDHADASMRRAIAQFVTLVRSHGAAVHDVTDTDSFPEILGHHRTILAAEAAAEHHRRRDEYPDEYPVRISALMDEGLAIPAVAYLEAKRRQVELSRWQWDLLGRAAGDGIDALIVPAATGPAPDRTTTGSPIFNSPWTSSGQPTISLPIGLDPDGMPLAVQLVGFPGGDWPLFQVANWCESAIRKGLH